MPVRAVLLDLLMATMDSISTWTDAAGERALGLAWRDAVTEKLTATEHYVPYEGVVADAARALGLVPEATTALWRAWVEMEPWPDVVALNALPVPYAFVTNCSAQLAQMAVERSGLQPTFTLSAEEAGWYKPQAGIYRAACQRLQVDPAEVRFVAGAPYDALGARAAGLGTMLVARRPVGAELPAGISIVSSLHEALAGI